MLKCDGRFSFREGEGSLRIICEEVSLSMMDAGRLATTNGACSQTPNKVNDIQNRGKRMRQLSLRTHLSRVKRKGK